MKPKPGLGGLAANPRLTTGPLVSDVPGRTDALPVDVPDGSYVVPADVVSALGQGNTLAGHKALKGMLTPKGPVKHKRIPAPKYADGGPVPIAAAGGEYVCSPEEVEAAGGHKALDMFVKQVRAANIAHLASLPGPKK